jgi:hydroxyacylglutathione hydrolase
MLFERIKSAGLAHNSYFIASGGTAAVIDPRRDCQVYADLARQHELKVRYILETHRQEDFAIGSIELQEITGAAIYHGPGQPWRYGETMQDGQEFRLGKLLLRAHHTPGHTDESMSIAAVDTSTGPQTFMVFTGDALFTGDTGRTDLYGSEQVPRLAAALYDSLFGKILPLGDGVIICPAHGAGSVCGMNIADRDESTIGIEKLQNPALQAAGREEFVRLKMAEKPERPPYFSRMEAISLAGPPRLGSLPAPEALGPADFKAAIDRGGVVVDTSEVAAFGGIHIKGAYSIWLEGVPSFAGWVLPYDTPILLVLEDQSYLDRAVRYLVRLGYDDIGGYLRGGIASWYNASYPLEGLPLLSVHQLKRLLDRGEDIQVLDVRGRREWDSGHIAGAMHIYIGHLARRLAEVPRHRPVAVYCGSGHRASLGASILLRAGFPTVYNVPGSITAWKAAGFPMVQT